MPESAGQGRPLDEASHKKKCFSFSGAKETSTSIHRTKESQTK